MNSIIRYFVICAVFALSASAIAQAQVAEDSASNIPYVGLDAGFSLASAEFETSDNDVPSRCDLHYAGSDGIVPSSAANFSALRTTTGVGGCSGGSSTWKHDFGTSLGHTVGVTVGVSKITGLPLRAEIEYLYRNNEFNEKVDPDFGGPKSPEFVSEFGGLSYGELGDVESHNLFANVYYDFHLDNSSITPYIGGGLGWSRTKFDLVHFFQRNNGGDTADGSNGHPGAAVADCEPTATNDCVLEILEGVVSYANNTHEDSTIGFQVLLGFDYALSKKLSAGLKLRWAYFGDIEGDREQWDTLRSHRSTITDPDATDVDDLGRGNIVTYQTTLKSDQFWGAALSLKYYLN
ncbi:outer membrane protein [Candidatus Mycalebacterium sp.]